MPKRAANPNQMGLFGEPGSIDDAVQKAEAEKQPAAAPQLNLNRKDQKPHYHIMKGYLTTLDYSTLHDIFYGMHQVNIPQKMKEAMNPIEILALYCGMEDYKKVFKKDNSLGYGEVELECGVTAEEIVSDLVNNALNYNPVIASWQNRAKKFYSTGKGDMKVRIHALDDETKHTFLKSVREPRKISNAENSWKYDFYDPNCDGQSREVYAANILGMIKK